MGDLDRELILTVYGEPAPKGSMKCIGGSGRKRHQLVDNSPRTGPWRERVARGAKRLPVSHLTGPLGVEVTLTLPRPGSHYGTGRNASRLRTTAPAHPSRRSQGVGGDVDKLARTILDALEDAGTLTDDAQVVELVTRKTYVDGPGVLPDALTYPGARIRLYPIEETQ